MQDYDGQPMEMHFERHAIYLFVHIITLARQVEDQFIGNIAASAFDYI